MTISVKDLEYLLNKASVEHFQHGPFTQPRLQDVTEWADRKFMKVWAAAREYGLILKDGALDYVPSRPVCAEFGTLSERPSNKELAGLKLDYRNAVARACNMDIPAEWMARIDAEISRLLENDDEPIPENVEAQPDKPEAAKPKKAPSAEKKSRRRKKAAPEIKAEQFSDVRFDPADFEPIKKVAGLGGHPYIRLSRGRDKNGEKRIFTLVMRDGNEHFDVFKKTQYAQILVNGKTGRHLAVRIVKNADDGFRISTEKHRLEIRMIGSTGEQAAQKLGLDFSNENIPLKDVGWIDSETIAFEVGAR